MCGISGRVGLDADREALARAEHVQNHRGPDARGTERIRCGRWWVEFGHQRLAILDLTSAAHQPMRLPKGGTAVFNGEIYNYRELRSALAGRDYGFTSTGDTEVLLAALDHWGVEGALERFNGMWAFAWFDPRGRKLYLCRDRSGIKPLYYSLRDGVLYFASELKGLLAMAPGPFDLDMGVVHRFVRQSLLDASPESIVKGVRQLPASHYLEVDLDLAQLKPVVKRYWELPSHGEEWVSGPGLVEQVRETFRDAVRLRLRADVPVGVLLSGGIDSSAIACTMHRILPREAELNLLSAVSSDDRFDESPFIDVVGRYLGRKVEKVDVDYKASEALEMLKKVTLANDEPVSGLTSVAHYLLMQRAKELGVTVVLSGQGADELLCGYRKYLGFYIQWLARNGRYVDALRVLAGFLRRGTVIRQFSLQDAKRYLPLARRRERDLRGEALLDHEEIDLGLGDANVQARQLADLTSFSVPQLVHYEDRMSMAWSREIRLPFLDFRLIELLAPLSPQHKLRDGWTKYVFRKSMEPWMPSEITWRKDKQPFSIPQSEWLKNELKDQVLQHFSADALIFQMGIVDRKRLLEVYREYCRQPPGRGMISHKDVFNPLSLEIWLRTFKNHVSIRKGAQRPATVPFAQTLQKLGAASGG